MELLKLLRRIVILSVAVYGLARGMPYLTLLFRLVALWAVLYICSGIVDVVFRHLAYRAMLKQQIDLQAAEQAKESKPTKDKKPSGSTNLPAVSAGHAG